MSMADIFTLSSHDWMEEVAWIIQRLGRWHNSELTTSNDSVFTDHFNGCIL